MIEDGLTWETFLYTWVSPTFSATFSTCVKESFTQFSSFRFPYSGMNIQVKVHHLRWEFRKTSALWAGESKRCHSLLANFSLFHTPCSENSCFKKWIEFRSTNLKFLLLFSSQHLCFKLRRLINHSNKFYFVFCLEYWRDILDIKFFAYSCIWDVVMFV